MGHSIVGYFICGKVDRGGGGGESHDAGDVFYAVGTLT